ncbi:MAG TPA: DUF1918 domain-containing protein [Actinomycetota bacterium]|nr:DUF1918 domain-containing protein [Actinomycetota bacterium]
MRAHVGDRIVVASTQVGQDPREGEILEVTEGPEGSEYRVRWADGHESLFRPKAGIAKVVAAARPKAARTKKKG